MALFGQNVMLCHKQSKSVKHWDSFLSHCKSRSGDESDDSFKDAQQIEEELSYINEPQTQVTDKGKEKAVDPPPFELRRSTRDRKECYPKDSIYGKQTPLETEK